MTPQEIFDTVAVHLIKQGKKSVDPGSMYCMYRAPDGCRCAVGVLIPDDLYRHDMEGKAADGLLQEVEGIPPWFREQAALLGRLQWVHDNNQPDDWRDVLADVAADNCLSTAALDALEVAA